MAFYKTGATSGQGIIGGSQRGFYEPKVDVGTTPVEAAVGIGGASLQGIKAYNTIQNTKLTKSRLLKNPKLTFKQKLEVAKPLKPATIQSGTVNQATGLPVGKTHLPGLVSEFVDDDIFIPKVDQGFMEQFTSPWSKRVKINPEYIETVGNTLDTFENLEKTLKNMDIPDKHISNIMREGDWSDKIKNEKFAVESHPVFKKFGTGEGFLANIGKGSVKGAWQKSKPGKVVEAFKGIGKGGFKDLWKGSDAAKIGKAVANIGKGGLKGLFGAGTGAAGGAAGAGAAGAAGAGAGAAGAAGGAGAAGALALGPAGWTMLALSLLGAGKVFPKHTFLGKIFSDPRLKENIKIVGKSPSGINVYEYNYKEVEGTYRGVLASEVPWASSKDNHGHLMVDYSKVDVDFVRVK